MSNKHLITYCEAINEALRQEMRRDRSVFIYGIGVPDHKKIFDTTVGLLEEFGPERCFDTPIAEESMLGLGLGAAINGMRPIHVHIRVDFMLLAMNQIVNMLSSFTYASGGRIKVPMVIRAMVGRGWGQGCQHSKTMHSVFAHFPGLKVVMPTFPNDAKGLLVSAIRDDNPVIVIEHRWLYWQKGLVDKEACAIPIGVPKLVKEGKDITVVAVSWMNIEALHASKILEQHGIDLEIIDVRSINPLDITQIVESVNKTGRCIIADCDWLYCGFAAELISQISSQCFSNLKCPIERIGFAFTPCPTARHLENQFYSNASDIVRIVEKIFGLKPIDLSNEKFYSHEHKFKGPF